MKRKDYDDDLLVELIARGEMSHAEIGRRIRLGRSMVRQIARGQKRPDLQEKINTRMRNYLADKRRHPSQSAAETGAAPPVPTGYRNKEYDDELLVELIARGNLSYCRIAERVGLSPGMVGKIARGESRLDLRPRIAAIARGMWTQAFRMGAAWIRGLLGNHIKTGIEGDGDQARRCREFAMTFIAKHGHPGDAPAEDIEPVRGLSDLSPGLQKQILDELGVQYDDSWSVDQTAEGQESIKSVI